MDLSVQVITLPLGTGTQRSHGVFFAPFHAAVAACRRRRIEQQDDAWWLLRSKDASKPTPPPPPKSNIDTKNVCSFNMYLLSKIAILGIHVSLIPGVCNVQAGRIWKHSNRRLGETFLHIKKNLRKRDGKRSTLNEWR